MEVKIKEGNGYVDAEWTIEDGVMVVSPVVKFEPKDGDVIVCSNRLGYWTLLVKRIVDYNIVFHHAVLIDNGILKINDRSSYSNPRSATEEEKKKLFDKLAEEGWEWKADTKELVKIKWKPKVGEDFYYPFFKGFKFVVRCFSYDREESINEDEEIQSGKVFKTKKECQEFCNRLNDAISQVKS